MSEEEKDDQKGQDDQQGQDDADDQKGQDQQGADDSQDDSQGDQGGQDDSDDQGDSGDVKDDVDERGVPWKNVAAENKRKLEATERRERELIKRLKPEEQATEEGPKRVTDEEYLAAGLLPEHTAVIRRDLDAGIELGIKKRVDEYNRRMAQYRQQQSAVVDALEAAQEAFGDGEFGNILLSTGGEDLSSPLNKRAQEIISRDSECQRLIEEGKRPKAILKAVKLAFVELKSGKKPLKKGEGGKGIAEANTKMGTGGRKTGGPPPMKKDGKFTRYLTDKEFDALTPEEQKEYMRQEPLNRDKWKKV